MRRKEKSREVKKRKEELRGESNHLEVPRILYTEYYCRIFLIWTNSLFYHNLLITMISDFNLDFNLNISHIIHYSYWFVPSSFLFFSIYFATPFFSSFWLFLFPFHNFSSFLSEEFILMFYFFFTFSVLLLIVLISMVCWTNQLSMRPYGTSVNRWAFKL